MIGHKKNLKHFKKIGIPTTYLKKENFAQNDIKIQFQDFAHPIYNQVSTNEFVSGLSILDALFNCGIDGVKHMLMKN